MDLFEYEVNRILDRQVIWKGHGSSTQYLIQWKGWGPEHNQWYPVHCLQDCAELIEEYEQWIQQQELGSLVG